MSDLEPVVGSTPDQPDADAVVRYICGQFSEWLAERQRTTRTPNFALDLSNPPKKKKNTKPSAKKRKSSEVQELEKKLKLAKLSNAATDKFAKIKKLMDDLKKNLESMESEKTEIDRINKEVDFKTLSTEINEIKNKIDKINEDAAKTKVLVDDEIKQWQMKEQQARNDMQKSIADNQKKLDATEKEAIQNIETEKQRAKEEIDKINRDIANIKDEEYKELTNIKNNIEEKKNALAKQQEQSKNNIERKKEEAADEIAKIEKKIKEIEENEKTEIKEIENTLTKAIDESNKRIRKKRREERRQFFQRPSTSSDPIEISDDETPSDTKNTAYNQWPYFWFRFRSNWE